jgi:dihydrodipicolinate synthase/N-acetylneuraminate lyase
VGGAARLQGALAASVTPLRDAGAGIDAQAIAALVDFYAAAGLDGLLVLGTTGEGVLLSVEERRAAAAAFLQAARGRLDVAVHCGAQSTRDTCALAADAAENGASAVAVIPPPYYPLDDDALLAHLASAAAACAPLAFYVYEFAARSGYAVPTPVLRALQDATANFVGLKVSDSPFEQVEPYLGGGLDVLIGAEALIHRGLQRGAVGAVSGLAAALPELTIAAVRSGAAADSARAGRARASLQTLPLQAALKALLRLRGVRIRAETRAPLRALNDGEHAALEQLVRDPRGEIAPVLPP